MQTAGGGTPGRRPPCRKETIVAIKRAKSSFSAVIGGTPRVVTEGTLVEDGDPILRGREHLFETVETFMSDRAPQSTEKAPVEQATAEPGEKRTVRKPPARTRTTKEAS